MDDALAALQFLRRLPEVDTSRMALAGHSFGGSLTLLLAARDTTARAVVVFGAAAASWDGSAELRARLRDAVTRVRAPIFFVHAANDYSVRPGRALADEMTRLGKVHRLKIYPAFGATPAAGHNLVFRNVAAWESDVFAFLDTYLRP
jgi:dipeptidyl aminopeptidase/acylaminoacyl peptidase